MGHSSGRSGPVLCLTWVSYLVQSLFCCYYVVIFFLKGDVWICMEVMDTSLDKFYKDIYKRGKVIPEEVLGKIAAAVSLESLTNYCLTCLINGPTPSSELVHSFSYSISHPLWFCVRGTPLMARIHFSIAWENWQ